MCFTFPGPDVVLYHCIILFATNHVRRLPCSPSSIPAKRNTWDMLVIFTVNRELKSDNISLKYTRLTADSRCFMGIRYLC
jgi:hypothetical protein